MKHFIMFVAMLMVAMFVSAEDKKEDNKGLVVKAILESVDKDIQKGFAGRAQAIKKLEQLLTIDDECIEVYYKLATCYYKNSKKKQAIKYYNIVLERIGGPTLGDLGKMYDDSQEKINELDPVMKQIRKLKQEHINALVALSARYKDKRIDEELALLGAEVDQKLDKTVETKTARKLVPVQLKEKEGEIIELQKGVKLLMNRGYFITELSSELKGLQSCQIMSKQHRAYTFQALQNGYVLIAINPRDLVKTQLSE